MFESWPELWGGGYSGYRTTLRKFLWFRTVTGGNAPEYDTVIGRIVSFITRRAAPLKIEADLEPIQSGSGDPSPDNVRPISGHSGAVVTDTGTNIWGGEKMANDMVAAVNNSATCFKDSDSYGDYVRLNVGAAMNQKVLNTCKFKENTQYTVIFKAKKSNTNENTNVSFHYTDGGVGYWKFPTGFSADTVYTVAFTSLSGKND